LSSEWHRTWQECSLGGTLQSFEFLLLIGYSAWLQRSPIMCSDWLKFQKSFQKPLDKYDFDIIGMFIKWSCTSFEFLVLIEKNKMAATTVFNIGTLGKMNKSFFL
jgi:hypothetical protein